jgi:hypothetical protein
MNTEKVIQADIECLLNSIGKAAAGGNTGRALEACGMLKERIDDLERVRLLKEISKIREMEASEANE